MVTSHHSQRKGGSGSSLSNEVITLHEVPVPDLDVERRGVSSVHPHIKLLLPVGVQTPTHHLTETQREREREIGDVRCVHYLASSLLSTQFELAVRITEPCCQGNKQH